MPTSAVGTRNFPILFSSLTIHPEFHRVSRHETSKRQTGAALVPLGGGCLCLVLLLCMTHGSGFPADAPPLPSALLAWLFRPCFLGRRLGSRPCWPWLVFAVPSQAGPVSGRACAGRSPAGQMHSRMAPAPTPRRAARPKVFAAAGQVWGLGLGCDASGLVGGRGRIPTGAWRHAAELQHMARRACGYAHVNVAPSSSHVWLSLGKYYRDCSGFTFWRSFDLKKQKKY